jgi:hypothetical protein
MYIGRYSSIIVIIIIIIIIIIKKKKNDARDATIMILMDAKSRGSGRRRAEV